MPEAMTATQETALLFRETRPATAEDQVLAAFDHVAEADGWRYHERSCTCGTPDRRQHWPRCGWVRED